MFVVVLLILGFSNRSFREGFISCTSFSSLVKRPEDKRRRLSFFALEDIVVNFIPYVFLYDLSVFIIISRVRSKSVFPTFFRKLKLFDLKCFGCVREFLNPHNGVRGRKLRRR